MHSSLNYTVFNLAPASYSPSCFFLPSLPIQMPFFYFDPNELCNYPKTPEVTTFSSFLQPANMQQGVFGSPLLNFIGKQEPSPQKMIQNGKEVFSSVVQKQRKTLSVKKQNQFKRLKQVENIKVKSGNQRFIKKNTESNVVNQVFSFLWSPEKSRSSLCSILKDEAKVNIFYQLMRAIKVNCKPQLNRMFLKQLMNIQEWQGGFKKLRKKIRKIEQLQHSETVSCIRRLVFLYLRQISRFSIMTSKKMNPQLWRLHFQKCQQIIEYLFENIEP